MSSTLIATDATKTGSTTDPKAAGVSYLRVWDNRNGGGFAGAKSLSTATSFRCAYTEVNGEQRGD